MSGIIDFLKDKNNRRLIDLMGISVVIIFVILSRFFHVPLGVMLIFFGILLLLYLPVYSIILKEVPIWAFKETHSPFEVILGKPNYQYLKLMSPIGFLVFLFFLLVGIFVLSIGVSLLLGFRIF